MEDDIHFLVNEIEGELQSKIKDILKDIDKPRITRDNVQVKKFTRAIVQATARKLYPRQPSVQRVRQQPDIFAELREIERRPLHLPRIIREFSQQPYYTPVILPKPIQPAREYLVEHEHAPTIPPATRQPQRDEFLTSGLPPKPPEEKPLQKMPTDETMSFTPISFTQYKLPLSQEMQQAQAPEAVLRPSAMTAPMPSPPSPQAIPLTVPQGVEPPLAIIIDGESKKPIVTVAIQDGVYMVNEPVLNPEEINMITWMRKKFFGKEKKLMNKKKVNKKIWKAAKKMRFSMQRNDETEYIKVKYYLVKHLLQYSWIEPLLHDELIKKVICEGENIPVIIVRNDKTLKTNIAYPSAEHINRFLMKFATRSHRKISEKNPVFDFTASNYHIEGSLKTLTTQAKFTLTKVA